MENTENGTTPQEPTQVQLVFQVLFAPDRRLWRITCGNTHLDYNQEEFVDQVANYFHFVTGLETSPQGSTGDYTFTSPRGGSIQLSNIELVAAENLLCYLLRCNFGIELQKRGLV